MSEADDMTPETRGELRQELRALEDRTDKKLEVLRLSLIQDLTREVTRAVMEKMSAEMDRQFEERMQRLRRDLGAEIAHHIRASEERMVAHFRALDDKFGDLPKRVANLEQEQLPARVTRLETAVFPPKRKRR